MDAFGDPTVIERVLSYPRWAVVGCSPSPARDSFRIARLLVEEGYGVVPVNPEIDTVLGRRCYPDLAAVPGDIDVVDVFRRSEHVGELVDQAIAIGARAVWTQLGVVDRDAAQRAATAGLDVVMNRCPAIELPRLRPRPLAKRRDTGAPAPSAQEVRP